MPLPPTVHVKLSSEDAGTISITPVISQEMSSDELVALLVSVNGKEVDRVRRILRGGALLDGGTRYRWTPLEVDAAEVARLLAEYPDADPSRPFSSEECREVVLFEARGRFLRLARETAARRKILRRRSYWDVLASLANAGPVRYQTYSYREQADLYRLELAAEASVSVRGAAGLLSDRRLVRRLKAANLVAIEFLVSRGA